METIKRVKADLDKDVCHDFLHETYILSLFSGYILFDRPIYRNLQIVFLVLVFILTSFQAILAVYTIIITDYDKAIMVKLIHTLSIYLGGIMFQVAGFQERQNLLCAIDLLKKGLYYYQEILEEQRVLLKNKIKLVRFLANLMSNAILSCFVSYSFLTPLLILLFMTEFDDHNGLLNRYLSLPIYMPFDTNTVLGFSAAFALNTLYYLSSLVSFAINAAIAVSGALQITTHLDVLKYSLERISERAFLKFKAAKRNLGDQALDEDFSFGSIEFQQYHLICLRENLQHHIEIKRLMDVLQKFLNKTLRIIFLLFSLVLAAAINQTIQDGYNLFLTVLIVSDIMGFLELSIVCQLVSDKSISVQNYLYSTPWYSCNKEYNILLCIMLTYSGRPFVVTALGLTGSIETFGDMCSLAYKTVNVLR